jgi:hypothetical protein
MGTRDDEDPHETHLGEVPEGVGADLYPKHLEGLSRDAAFEEGVLSFPDGKGGHHEVPLDQVAGTEKPDAGSDRGKILLRNGVIIVASGAAIAAAIAAVRYRRRHKQ